MAIESNNERLAALDQKEADEQKSVEGVLRKPSVLRRLFGFVIYLAVVFGIALSAPKALSWFLDTPHPMAAITSQSMWPVLRRGDLVFVRNIPVGDIEPGDVIVYTQGSTFIIHRVIRTESSSVITKGDASMEEDSPVDHKEIIGVVPTLRERLVKIPYLGRLALYANKRTQ